MVEGPRALLTDSEREAIRGKEDMNENTRSTLLGRVQRKMRDNLETDVELLREHRPELAASLHEIVCEEDTDTRIDNLEEEVAALRRRIDELEKNESGPDNT